MTNNRMQSLSSILLASQPIVTTAWFWQTGSWKYTNDIEKLGETAWYYQEDKEDFLSNKAQLQFEYHGCKYSYANNDNYKVCPEESSEDGTYYWYKYSNCRQSNVAFSLYGGDSSSSCSKDSYLDSYTTTGGLHEFVYLMEQYDANTPITFRDVYGLPLGCVSSEDLEEGDRARLLNLSKKRRFLDEDEEDGVYYAIGCTQKSNFEISEFSDQYCSKYVGSVDSLNDVNEKLQQVQCTDCRVNNANVYGYNDNYNRKMKKKTMRKLDEDAQDLCEAVLEGSKTCGPMDSVLCDNYGSKRKFYKTLGIEENELSPYARTDAQKITDGAKYAFGTVFTAVGCMALVLGAWTNKRKMKQLYKKFRRMRREKKKGGGKRTDKSPARRASRSRSRGRKKDHYDEDGERIKADYGEFA